MFAAQLRLPSNQLVIQGRRPHWWIFGERESRGAQDERLGLPAAETTMRTDEFLESGDLSGDAVDGAQQNEVAGVREAIEATQVLGRPRPIVGQGVAAIGLARSH